MVEQKIPVCLLHKLLYRNLSESIMKKVQQNIKNQHLPSQATLDEPIRKGNIMYTQKR